MENSKPKRIRAANWDLSDKILLRELIEEKISIIENKCVDTNTTRQKKDAWKEVLLSFNNMSATPRDIAQLQSQWRGMKLKAKATASSYRKDINATGGGAMPKSPDLEHEKMMALIPQEFEEGVNEFDCDAEMNQRTIMDKNVSEMSIEYENLEFLQNYDTPPPQPSPPPAASVSPSPATSKPPLQKHQNKKKTDEH